MAEPLIAEIRSVLDRFLAESMQDPDLAARSVDYRAGYTQGFREAIAATLALLLQPKGRDG